MFDEKARAEADAIAKIFTDKLNELTQSFLNPDGTMPVITEAAIHGVLLEAAGFTEAMIFAGSEALAMERVKRGIPTKMPYRLSMEQIYAVYTHGFNNGFLDVEREKAQVEAIAQKIVNLELKGAGP